MNNFLLKESAKLFFYVNVIFYLPLYFYFCLSSRTYDLAIFFYSFAKWDSGWYLGIAQSGYPQFLSDGILRGDLVYLWPPLYPLILKIITVLMPFPLSISIFLLQNIIFFGVIYTTLKLLNVFIKFSDCKKITLLFLMFPMSIFFYSAYSEGVFLIFLNVFLYYLIKGENYKAAIFGSFLPVIRYIGIFSIFLLNFFILFGTHSEKKSGRFILLQGVNILVLNIIFLIPFGCWILFNFFNTLDPLFFLTVRDSSVAFQEWGKYQGPFYFYFFKWFNMIFNSKYWIEYKLAGFFVLLYISMNIITFKMKVKNSLASSLRALSCLGIFFAIYPFTTGIESLWRYGYIFPIQFISFKKIIDRDNLYNFLLIIFASFKIAFGIAFISSLHIT